MSWPIPSLTRAISRALPPRRHPETWVEFDSLRCVRPYRKTFRFPGHATGFHASLATAPTGRMGVPGLIDLGVDGFLWPEEAMKLYELAYFTSGDVLELGTFNGLSTSILANALHDRDSGSLVTCDIEPSFTAIARTNTAHRPGGERIEFQTGDATALMDKLADRGRIFEMMFVDHWHGYDATREAATRAGRLLSPGGYILFHDYTDGNSNDPNHPNKVFQAVRDTIATSDRFRFLQVCASMGVFQRVR